MTDPGCKSVEEECKEQIYHCDNTSGWLPSSFVRMCVGREQYQGGRKCTMKQKECGSALWDRKKEVTLYGRGKNEGANMRQKGTVPLILHWLLFFDIDSTS